MHRTLIVYFFKCSWKLFTCAYSPTSSGGCRKINVRCLKEQYWPVPYLGPISPIIGIIFMAYDVIIAYRNSNILSMCLSSTKDLVPCAYRLQRRYRKLGMTKLPRRSDAKKNLHCSAPKVKYSSVRATAGNIRSFHYVTKHRKEL